jgi:CubicO group peptidase (beta-lactamase class C family)
MKRALFLMIVLSLMVLPSKAQDPVEEVPKQSKVPVSKYSTYLRGSSLDDIIGEYLEQSGAPGLSVVVIKGDEIVHEGAYGLASVELKVPVSRETVYQTASTTKVFTGVAVMMLIDQGELALSDHVTDIIPGLPETWKEVTVHHILTHTSGIPDALDERGQAIAATPESLFNILAGKPLDYQPGDDWSYNQTGYVLAGEIIRIRTGFSFNEFCRKHIFQPLGMNSTSFGGVHHLIPDRASYYTADASGALVPYVDGIYPELSWTGAGVNTSARDFALFDIALRQGKILKPETREAMLSPVRLNDHTIFRHRNGTTGYGCGWSHIDYPDHPAVGMEGGHTNAYYRFIEDDLAIIVLTNFVARQPPSLLVERIAGHFISGFRSPNAQRREFENLLADSDPRARALGRQLVNEAWSNAAMLTSVAWVMATTDRPSHRDLDTALRAAQRAAALTRHEDAEVLETLARVHHEMGNAVMAVHWQQEAVGQAGDYRYRDELNSTLAQYKQALDASNN